MRIDPMTPVTPLERISRALGLVVGVSPLLSLVVFVTSVWAKLTWTAVRWFWGLWG